MKRIVALLVIVCFVGGTLGCAKINLDARGQDQVLSMTKNANRPYTRSKATNCKCASGLKMPQ